MNRATLACGVILAIWWACDLWPDRERASVPARQRVVPVARTRAALPREPAPRDERPGHEWSGRHYRVRSPTRDDAEYLCTVAHHADDIARELLHLPPPSARARTPIVIVWSRAAAAEESGRGIVIVDTTPIEPVLAALVARTVLAQEAPGFPPFLEAGIAAHVATWFDGTWTDERRLDEWVETARSTGFVEPVRLGELPRDRIGEPPFALYALLFVDMLAYADRPGIAFVSDPSLADLLPRFRARAAREPPEEVFVDLFGGPDVASRWKQHLRRFRESPVPTPSYR